MNRLPGRQTAFDAEGHHAAEAVPQVFHRGFMTGRAGQARIVDPFDRRVPVQVVGHGLAVFAVPFHAQGEGLDALEKEPAVVRRDAGPEVAQRHQTHAQGEGDGVHLARGHGHSAGRGRRSPARCRA